jgi:hypothetical protein
MLHCKASLIATARSMAQNFSFAGICIVNHGFVTVTKSWLCNTQERSNSMLFQQTHDHALFVATDQDAFEELESFKRARRMRYSVVLHEINNDGSLQASLAITQAAYWQWLVHRVNILKLLIDAGIDIVLFETDAVWLRCAFREWTLARKSNTNKLLDVEGVKDGTGKR